MAKDSSGVEAQRARLANGQPLEGGWCFDGDREPDVFRCGEIEERVAAGEISVSYDGTKVVDLKTGELSQGKKIERNRPVTLAEVQAVSGAPVATGADTVTTGNPPPRAAGRP